VQVYTFTSGVTDTVGLTLTLGSNWAANTLFDDFITLNGGVPVQCTVPWTSSGAGTSARSTALSIYAGMQTNATLATCRISNSSTFSMAANQGTYVGTFLTNSSTGQVDLKFGTQAAGGGAAVAGIWNMYNRTPGGFDILDSTATFGVSSTSTWQPLDVGGTGSGLNNRFTFVTGSGDDAFDASLVAGVVQQAGNYTGLISIGINSTSAQSTRCSGALVTGTSGTVTLTSACKSFGVPGLNYLQALFYANNTNLPFSSNNAGGPWAEGFHVLWWW
jgi:hypothetical protein